MAESQKRVVKMNHRDGSSPLQTEQAYHRIKEMILLGETAPLAMLEEKKLMAELGFGRTPIREALLRLSYEDLVTIVPFRGMFAAGIDLADLDEVMELRIPMERLAARLAAERISDDEVRTLRGIVQGVDVAGLCERGDIHGLLKLDHDFHHAVAAIAKNRFLEKTLDNLRDFTWRFHVLYYKRRRPSVRDHFNNYLEIIDALAQRDPAAAEAAINRHFEDQRL